MVKVYSINEVLHTPDVANTDDIMLDVSVKDLSEHTAFYDRGTLRCSLTDLIEQLNSGEAFADGFILNEGIPTPLVQTKGFEFKETASLPEKAQTSSQGCDLLTLFNLLQIEEAYFLFEPYMYKDITGSHSFEDFVPTTLSNLYVSFQNMIISNKKFNVVFATVISGTINNGLSNNEVVRYYPFKIIKGGNLIYNELKVFLPKTCNNQYLRQLLTSMSAEVDGDMFVVDLTKLPVYNKSLEPLTANSLYYLRTVIDEYRLKTKALKFLIDELKTDLQFRGEIGLGLDWYRGDEVILDTLSDEGLPLIDIWISGKKTHPTINSVKSALGAVGNSYFDIIKNILVNQVSQPIVDDSMNKLLEVSDSFRQKNWLNDRELELLKECINLLNSTLTPKEKYENLKRSLREYNVLLNSVELKYLQLRFNILDNCPANTTMANDFLFSRLGEVSKATQTYVSLYSPLFNDSVSIKREIVGGVKKQPEQPKIELPTAFDTIPSNEPINTDFRERD